MERREVSYVQPAGRQANATQEAFARARSVWPRLTSTTGPNRERTSSIDVTRRCPKPTCAGPPGRARACRVLCGLLGLRELLLSSLLSKCSSSPHCSSLLFTTLLSARSLRRLCALPSLSRFFPAFFVPLISPSPSTPSLTSARAAKMRWFRGREARRWRYRQWREYWGTWETLR